MRRKECSGYVFSATLDWVHYGMYIGTRLMGFGLEPRVAYEVAGLDL